MANGAIKQIKNIKSSEKGSALIEGAIVFPFLIFVFMGMIELGMQLRELSWINNLTCQTAGIGSITDAAYSAGSMKDIWDKLYPLSSQRMYSDVDTSGVAPSVNTVSREVVMAALPETDKLFNLFHTKLKTGCSAGYLVPVIDTTSYTDFSNKVGDTWYDCNGNPGTGTAACTWSTGGGGGGGGCSTKFGAGCAGTSGGGGNPNA